jgi:hypothetical protein
MMSDPDYVYDPEDWEVTQEWSDRSYLVDELYVGELKRFSTLIQGPNKYAAHVVLTRDEAGDPDETKIRWFDTEAEAKAALSSTNSENR